MSKKIVVYTDGSALGNPGPGGFGIVMKYGKHRKEMSGGFRKTTNNRMELLSIIIALESIKWDNMEVDIYSDSKYVVDAVEKGWIYNWAAKRFKKKKNPDLWLRFMDVYPKHHIKLHWVKGHSGIIDNERCDRLAVQAANQANLEVDTFYEKTIEDNQGMF